MHNHHVSDALDKILERACHCVKSVRIRSYSGPHFPAFGLNTQYSVRMRENADQNNSEYRHCLRSVYITFKLRAFCPCL